MLSDTQSNVGYIPLHEKSVNSRDPNLCLLSAITSARSLVAIDIGLVISGADVANTWNQGSAMWLLIIAILRAPVFLLILERFGGASAVFVAAFAAASAVFVAASSRHTLVRDVGA